MRATPPPSSPMPPLPWSGACRCGQTRFRVNALPMLSTACHCTGCQRMSASAFSLTLAVPAPALEVTQGEPVVGGLHGATKHMFCPHCMSWMFTRPEGMEAMIVNVRASMLDEHRWFTPFVEFWTREKLPWASTPTVHSYETQPDRSAYEGLAKEYAQTLQSAT